MLATGLPVYGFDIGAQGEALRRSVNGHTVPFDPDSDLAQDILTALQAAAPETSAPQSSHKHKKAAE
jgi:hypothetical protein